MYIFEGLADITKEQEPESKLERAEPVESGAEPVDKERPLWLWPEDTDEPNSEGRKCCLLRTKVEEEIKNFELKTKSWCNMALLRMLMTDNSTSHHSCEVAKKEEGRKFERKFI